MIKSMTGFGRAQEEDQERRFTVEIKSVNHRYLDFNIKMPKKLSFFEASIRSLMKEYMQRGKVDVFITCEDFTKSNVSLTYHQEIAKQYLEYFREMSRTLGVENDVTASVLGRCPEVFAMEEEPIDEKEIWELLEKCLRSACRQFAASRQKEGETLAEDLKEKLVDMAEKVEQVEARSPQIVKEYRKKLEQKLEEILADTQADENRVAAEVVLFADKICTDEETVRLKSHINSMLQVLEQGDGVGRKLDFIAQEMNREANTILSKANDLTTSNLAIDLKTEIEKVREQIQNIE
ncbi:MAG TPA: YicC family protein [Candidatus Pullilachnospira intestinigallinarum]|nr:YicC family protein [Candidatus Pullilachnospira intestinigallinarum]